MDRGLKLSRLNHSEILSVLPVGARRKLSLFSLFRVLANGMDILGIVGISALSAAFAYWATGNQQSAQTSLPFVGEAEISEQSALILALIVASLFTAKSIVSVLLNLVTAKYVAQLETQMTTELIDEFFFIQSPATFGRESVSEFQNTLIGSITGVRDYINSRVLLVAEGSLLISMVVVFAFVNLLATFLLAGFMGSAIYILNRIIRVRLMRSSSIAVNATQGTLELSRDLHGIRREAQASGSLESWLSKIRSQRRKLAESQAILSTLKRLPRFVIETSLVLGLFLFLGALVLFSDIPTQAVTIGVFLAGGLRVMASVIPLQGAINEMRQGSETGKLAVEALLQIQSMRGNPIETLGEVKKGPPSVEFENVNFSHGEGRGIGLRNVSFHVPARSKVAIVGPSGSGKSTVFDLAMGFLIPQRGEVRVGGECARKRLTTSPGSLALVPQKPNLITGTLIENVSLVDREISDQARVQEVLSQVGLEWMWKEESWERKKIIPDSGRLSGGEIQRISLARALYKKPEILFLDEATSSLDGETEMLIDSVLEELRESTTIILIAHRLSTVKNADSIIYLENGEIRGKGNFEQLQDDLEEFANAVKIMGLKANAKQ